MVETLWEVANELDVRGAGPRFVYASPLMSFYVDLGYGLVLREKLSDKWCCLSCLGTVRLLASVCLFMLLL